MKRWMLLIAIAVANARSISAERPTDALSSRRANRFLFSRTAPTM
jgi:hypothetical protein